MAAELFLVECLNGILFRVWDYGGMDLIVIDDFGEGLILVLGFLNFMNKFIEGIGLLDVLKFLGYFLMIFLDIYEKSYWSI